MMNTQQKSVLNSLKRHKTENSITICSAMDIVNDDKIPTRIGKTRLNREKVTECLKFLVENGYIEVLQKGRRNKGTVYKIN